MGNKIKISMTDRAPVEIDTDEWPMLAEAKDHDNQYLSQANRIWEICVRRKDERVIVYGWKREGGGGMPVGEKSIYAGELTDESATVSAIRRVAEEIRNPELAMYVIRELPAETI